jgi:hypothetical protein
MLFPFCTLTYRVYSRNEPPGEVSKLFCAAFALKRHRLLGPCVGCIVYLIRSLTPHSSHPYGAKRHRLPRNAMCNQLAPNTTIQVIPTPLRYYELSHSILLHSLSPEGFRKEAARI